MKYIYIFIYYIYMYINVINKILCNDNFITYMYKKNQCVLRFPNKIQFITV